LLTDHLRIGPVIFRGRTYSPEAVTRQIDEVASFLDQRCRGRSPIVYLFATNHVKTVAAYLGILKSGRVCLLADPATKALEWAEMTRDAPPSAVIRFDESTDLLDLEREITLEDGALDQEAARELEDVCTLLFTAADDGYAKAAMLTHDNMLANARSVVECNSVDEGTPSCSLIPFCHLFALQTGLLGPAICGAPVSLVGPECLARLRSVVDALLGAGVERLYSVPPILYVLAKAWASTGTPKLPATVVSGGVKLPASILERYRQAFGKEIHEGYGLTEAAPICTWHRPLDRIRPQSVGRAFSCCDLRIEDESGNPAPLGTVGEVCVRGTNVMKGYLRHPVATSRALQGGWLHTGDLGRLDADGFLYLTGLKKRMLNVAGRKVYPAEVERMMRHHPNVQAITILGRDHEPHADVVCGIAKLHSKGAEEEFAFTTWCSESISAFKIPARLKFQ
jgi:long-chain acyl-CoA synthetase